MVNWLLPGAASPLEITISYEQLAVDLTAWLARSEPDPYLKQAYELGVLEDFDHLYRYANLYEILQHRKAERIVEQLTEVMPGRPTRFHHRHPIDNAREPYDRTTASPLSKLHTLTLVAAEQQTMNFYMNVGPQYMEPIARQLYQEIAMVEEEHVTHYGSLMDPQETWLERLLLHEYNECYLYHSLMEQESDRRVKAIWELHLNMELAHLQGAVELLRMYEGREAAALLPAELPETVMLEPNKEYLRELLATQLDLTTLGTGFVRDAHERFQRMQDAVLAGEAPPSDAVITQHNEMLASTDYRWETDGPHPRPELRQPAGKNG